jgi:hypothetical protein
MAETIFQNLVFQEFILPFLLIFAISFAILEKTKVLGEDKKTVNAIVSFVLGLVFVTAVFPKAVITNLVLFLSVALIVVFVVMLLWGFITEGDAQFKVTKGMKWFLIFGVGAGLLFLLIWTLKVQTGFFDWIPERDWTGPFWTNLLFVIVIAVALALVLKNPVSSGGKG